MRIMSVSGMLSICEFIYGNYLCPLYMGIYHCHCSHEDNECQRHSLLMEFIIFHQCQCCHDDNECELHIIFMGIYQCHFTLFFDNLFMGFYQCNAVMRIMTVSSILSIREFIYLCTLYMGIYHCHCWHEDKGCQQHTLLMVIYL